MSKNTKVTGKMLKDLINEVMGEEKRLNEIDISITNPSKWKDLKKDTGISSLSQLPQSKSADALKALNDLAGLDNDSSDITDDDLKAATGNLKQTADKWYANSSKTATERSANPTLDQYLASLAGGGGGSFIYGKILDSSGNLSSSLATQTGNPHKTKIANLLKRYANDPSTSSVWPNLLNDLATAFSGSDFGSKIKKQVKKLGGNTSSTQINAIADFMIDNPNDISFDKIQTSQPFGSIDFSSADTDTKGVKKADTMSTAASAIKNQIKDARFDASIINQMAVFDSDTIEGKLKQLNDAAATLNNLDSAALLAMGTEEKLKLATKLNVLTYITNISKVFDSSSAGFAFEKFVIAFFGGIGIGGVNGAIDAALAGKNGTVLPTSEKLLSGGYVKQSRGDAGGQGLQGALQEYDSILYFIGLKIGGTNVGDLHVATSYRSIKVYVLKLNKDGTIDNLSTSGDFVNTGETFEVVTDDSNIISFSKVNALDPLANLPMLANPDDSATAIANDIANDLSSDTFLAKLLNIYKRLENMKRNTQSYQATGGKKTSKSAAGKTAKEYVDEVAKDYSGMKTEYNSVFETAESGITTGTSLNESKKVTPNLLKKLIQEKFKK